MLHSAESGNFSGSGSRVRRRRSRSRSWRRRSRSQESVEWRNPGNTLYVTCLPRWATEWNLRQLFSTQGEVVDCHVIRNYSTKESCGYAFVTMATKDDAERCIAYFHHAVHFGRVLVVEMARRQARKKRRRTPTRGKYRVTRYEQEQRRRQTLSRSPRQQRRRQTLSHSPRQQRDEHRYSRDRSPSPSPSSSRSLSPVRKEDRYRYSSDRSRSQTPVQKENRYQYSRDQRGRSRSRETHRRQRE